MRNPERKQDEMTRLVEPLLPALRRYARMLAGDAAAADDLLQDCLERTFTRWHLRRPDSDVRPWMFAILHNLAVNQMRRDARHGPHVPIEDMHEAASAEHPLQESGMMQRDLLAAVSALPEEQRAVLLLVAIEQLSYAETAGILDIPLGTVMSRLSRAREKIQRTVDGSPASTQTLRIVR